MEDIRNCQLCTGKERGPRLALGQFDLCIFVEHLFVPLPEEQVKRLADGDSRRVDTSRTRQLHRGVQRAGNTNFVPGALGRSGPIETSNLADILASEIDDTRLKRGLE